MTAEVDLGSMFNQLLERPTGMTAAEAFLRGIKREAVIREVYKFTGMDSVSAAIMRRESGIKKVIAADHIAVATEIANEKRLREMHFVI